MENIKSIHTVNGCSLVVCNTVILIILSCTAGVSNLRHACHRAIPKGTLGGTSKASSQMTKNEYSISYIFSFNFKNMAIYLSSTKVV
jgi:hypothetical protein